MPPIGVLQGRLTPSRGRGIQFFPEETGEWEKEFESAREAGLASIELLVRPGCLRAHPLMSPEGRARIQELSERTGVRVPSVHGYFEKKDSYAQDLVDIVDATAALGAMSVLISFFHDKKLSPTPDGSWTYAYTLLAPAARRAYAAGVTLALEAELSAQTLKEFIAQAETPQAFGVYYDVGNQFACGFPVSEELEALGSMVVGVHLKDRLKQEPDGPESKSVPLGQGSADFAKTFESLKKIGYTRDLIIQGARGEDGKEVALYTQYREFAESIGKKVWQ